VQNVGNVTAQAFYMLNFQVETPVKIGATYV
jgi:hypothetical protein